MPDTSSQWGECCKVRPLVPAPKRIDKSLEISATNCNALVIKYGEFSNDIHGEFFEEIPPSIAPYIRGGAIYAPVNTKYTYTLPVWIEYSRQPADARRAWDKMISWLRKHEDGHVRILTDWLNGLGATLMEVVPPEDGTCGGTIDSVKKAYDEARRQYLHKQEEYEAEQTESRPRFMCP